MLYFTHKMSQLGAFIFKNGRARWAVPVNPGSCQTDRRILADFAVPMHGSARPDPFWGIYLLRIYHRMIYCSSHVEPSGPPRRAPAASPRGFFRSFRFGRRRKARLSDHARRQNTLCGIRRDWTCNSLHYDPALARPCFYRGGGVSATHQTQNVQPYFSRNRLAQSGVPATG